MLFSMKPVRGAFGACVSMGGFVPGFLSAIALFALTAPASAVTLTFDDVEDHGGLSGLGISPESIVEQGITIGNFPESHGAEGRIHIDDAGTGYSQYIDFTGPNPFDALQVLVNGIQSFLVEDPQTFEFELTPYPNVQFTGFRGGVEVASQTAIATGGIDRIIAFDAGFSALDVLRISALGPNLDDFDGFSFCFNVPCGHFDIDNLVLATSSVSAVPLPAPFALLLSGLAAVCLVARKRRNAII